MANRNSKKKIEQELENKLKKLVTITITILGITIFSAVFLAPTISSMFGLLSKNRGKEQNEFVFKPSPPAFTNLPEATKDKIIKIEGYGQEGTTVKIFVNGPEKGTSIVGSDGKFFFDNIMLISGKNTIFAKAVDRYGNEGDRTDVYTIEVDNQAPKIEIESPKNGETVRNLDKRVEIIGKVDEKATITIEGSSVIQKPDLSFSLLLGVDESGEKEVEIIAVDLAGNETKIKLFFTYQRPKN